MLKIKLIDKNKSKRRKNDKMDLGVVKTDQGGTDPYVALAGAWVGSILTRFGPNLKERVENPN